MGILHGRGQNAGQNPRFARFQGVNPALAVDPLADGVLTQQSFQFRDVLHIHAYEPAQIVQSLEQGGVIAGLHGLFVPLDGVGNIGQGGTRQQTEAAHENVERHPRQVFGPGDRVLVRKNLSAARLFQGLVQKHRRSHAGLGLQASVGTLGQV